MRPLDGDRGRTVTTTRGCTGGLANTEATGAEETQAETVELQWMGVRYSILVRMQDDDRGVELTMDSCDRTLIAEAERVGRADGADTVQPGGQKAGFCGMGLRH